ncbi:MAG TPA: SDR family NAD(P)-dependent oxidoreductase [Polyangiaceae bacterium]|nr:SDR family NAD(P)-dependent oxidoreductase [Polyangiaceae bacterium]
MPDRADQPLHDVVALVTGANAGIGRTTAIGLARCGARVFLAGRSEAKMRPVVDEIARATPAAQPHFLRLDLGDFESIRQCAEDFLRRDLPLGLLVNNAGVAGQRGLTKSGFELAFGTNHVGHFLLTNLLLDRLRRSAPARVITVASRAHYRAKSIDFEGIRRPTRSLTALDEYGVSKLANVLFSAELARRLEGTRVTTYSLHPGVVASNIWRRVPPPFGWIMKLFMISPTEGAKTTLHCATSADASAETGLYYDKRRPRRPSTLALDVALAGDLWRRSEAWTA